MLYVQYRTPTSYAPTAGQSLLIQCEFSGIPPGQTGGVGAGLIFAANPNPLLNYYVLGFNGSAAWLVWKVIAGTGYAQCAGTFVNTPASTGYGTGGRRCSIIIDNTGRLRLFDGGFLTLSLPMILGEATTITNGYVGFSPTGGSSCVLYNMRVYLVPTGWEPFIP
jgi:hypothetical protein